jgi:hypothetical protein
LSALGKNKFPQSTMSCLILSSWFFMLWRNNQSQTV